LKMNEESLKRLKTFSSMLLNNSYDNEKAMHDLLISLCKLINTGAGL
jgi:hypothetical protein